MKDGLFHRSLANIVIKGRPRTMEKEGKFLPVILHVTNRFPKTGVGLHQVVIELLLHPGGKLFHEWAAMGLMKLQALLGGHFLLTTGGVMFVYRPDGFEDKPTLRRKILRYLDVFATRMSNTVCQEGLKIAGYIA